MRVLELGAVVLAILAAVAPFSASFIERWFSGLVYPTIQRVMTSATNVVPLAVLDVLLLAAIVTLVIALVRGTRSAWRARRPAPLVRVLAHLAAAAAVVYLAFLITWGFNYRRVPMSQRLVVAAESPSNDDVVALGLRATGEINRLRDEAHRIGWVGDEWRDAHLRAAFAGVQLALGDAPPAVPGRVKRSVLGPYFRWTGVDGMINPFGLEVLANPDLLPFERPFVAAHEWAHLAGYADEAEANFVGWLTALRADLPAQYSAWLYLFWQVSGEVGQNDRARLLAALEPGPRRDVDAIAERLRRGRWPMLQMAGWAVYDQYLKANRVDEGIRSYGEVLTLILRARFEDGWTPVRRDGPPVRTDATGPSR
ncbi:MAG TPA: DUF3810 family protein [Vicinamibacterales bacterium]